MRPLHRARRLCRLALHPAACVAVGNIDRAAAGAGGMRCDYEFRSYVVTPEERLVRLETQMADQREDMKTLIKKVEDLTAAANKGRGAIAVFVTGGAIFGAIVSWIAKTIGAA